jgi:hypothetical protein
MDRVFSGEEVGMSVERKYAEWFDAAAEGLDGPPYEGCRAWSVGPDERNEAKVYRGIARMFRRMADVEEGTLLRRKADPQAASDAPAVQSDNS